MINQNVINTYTIKLEAKVLSWKGFFLKKYGNFRTKRHQIREKDC